MICFWLVKINSINAQIDTSIYNHPIYKSAMNNLYNLQYDKAIEDLVKFRTIPKFNKDVRPLQLLADCYWKTRRYQESKFCYDTLVKYNIDFTSIEKLHLSELSAMNGNYALASKYLIGVPGFEKKRNGYDNIARLNKEDTSIVILEDKQSSQYALFPALIKDSLVWVNSEQIKSASKGSELSKYFSSNNKLRLNSFIENSNKEQRSETIFSNPSSYTYSTETGKIYFTIFQQFFSKKVNINIPNYLRIAESKLDGSKVSEIINFSLGEGYYSMLQPVISPNGKVLIFISNYNNNQFDLYYSEKINSNNSWSKPLPLNFLNTNGDEVFPSFGIDGVLYFSTNGREGLGGLDVYKVNLKLLGGNDIIIHLPSPINSRHDDYGFNLLEDSTKGSMISKRNGTDVFYSVTFKNKLDTLKNKITFGKYKADLLHRDVKLTNKFSFNKLLKPFSLSREILFNNKKLKDDNQSLVITKDEILNKKTNKIQKIDLSSSDSSKNLIQFKKPKQSDSSVVIKNLNNNNNVAINKTDAKKNKLDNITKNDTISNLSSLDTSYFKNYDKHKKFKSISISSIPTKYVSSIKTTNTNKSTPNKNIQLKNYEDTSVTQFLIKQDIVLNKVDKNTTLLLKTNIQQSVLIVDSLKNRISLKPILIYSAADSVTIDLFDNGKYDHDTISIIYNNNMVVYKNEISTDEKKPVRFSFKLNTDASKNEIIIVADNLGLEPPNSAIILITDSLKKQYIKYISTDLSHNAILHFVKSNSNYP